MAGSLKTSVLCSLGAKEPKKRMNVARQNLVKAVEIMQKGHSERRVVEVDLSELCVGLIKLSQKKEYQER